MKRYLLSLSLILSIILSTDARRHIVVDASDRNPVIGATVIGNSGVIKGMTDNHGAIDIDDKDLPATVQCIGYDPVTISSSTDTTVMDPTVYQLKEVIFTPGDRPVKRVLCFAREYSSGIIGTDTMQYYCEYMAVGYITDGKVKGYRRFDSKPSEKGVKRYARITKYDRDSVFKPKLSDDITELSWYDFMAFLPDTKTEVPEALRNGADADTVQGKYGPKFMYRKKNGLFTLTADVLSDHKNRKWSPFLFKLIGLTTDITAGTWTLSFADNGSEAFGINEFVSGTYNIHLIGKGKWMKKAFNTKEPIEMNSYLEIYPLEITNLTVDEYKEDREEYSPIPFRYPDGLLPLSPAVQAIVERLDS